MTIHQGGLAASEKAAMLFAFLHGPFEDLRIWKKAPPQPLLGWLLYCREHFPVCFSPV